MYVQSTEVERLRLWGTSMTCGCVTEEGVSGKKENSMQYRSVEEEELRDLEYMLLYIDWKFSRYDTYVYVCRNGAINERWKLGLTASLRFLSIAFLYCVQ